MDKVVLTASEGTFAGLGEALKGAPVEVLERPLVSFCSPADWGEVDQAIGRRAQYRSLALTSPRAAAALTERVNALGIDWNDGNSPEIWTVGEATAGPLRGSIAAVRDPAGSESTQGAAERLGHAMLSAGASGPVLFLCGDRRREELGDILRAGGLRVHEVVCYRTVLASQQEARAALAGATLVVVASPAVVHLLSESCPPAERPALLAIGPTTAGAARMAGWEPAAVAGAPTVSALALAITGILTPR